MSGMGKITEEDLKRFEKILQSPEIQAKIKEIVEEIMRQNK